MARLQRPRRPIRVTDLLATATTASAMSLSNFQLITSSQTPLGCILAYDAPITGCFESDFTRGNICSAGCVRALQGIEDTLASVCDGVTAAPDSVLGQALAGTLVESLCPSATGSPPARSSTAAVVITRSTRPIGTFSQIPTAPPTTLHTSATRPASSSVSSSSSSSEDDTDADPSTPSPDPAAEPTTTPPTQPTQAVEPPPAVTTSPVAGGGKTPTGAQQTKPPPPQTAKANGEGDSGGGSPFDIASVTSGSSRQQAAGRRVEACLLGTVFLLLLLR